MNSGSDTDDFVSVFESLTVSVLTYIQNDMEATRGCGGMVCD